MMTEITIGPIFYWVKNSGFSDAKAFPISNTDCFPIYLTRGLGVTFANKKGYFLILFHLPSFA